MALGGLNTSRSWEEVIRELRDELRKFGWDDYILPTRRDSLNAGKVSLLVNVDGRYEEIYCNHFSGQHRGEVRNLVALTRAIKDRRLMEQRGIAGLFDQVAKIAALNAFDPYRIIGATADMPLSEKKRRYHEKLQQYHPDKPEGNRLMFDLVHRAGKELELS